MRLHSKQAMTSSKSKLTIREIVVIPLLAAIMFTAKVCMAALPNIEPVSLLIIVYTGFLKKKTLITIYIYVLLEGVFYGFGSWWIAYLYVWAVLFLFAYILRNSDFFLIKAALGAIFGLLFGTMCSLPYFFIGGISYGISYIISGLPFDLLHCLGNAVLIGVFYKPLSALFKKIPLYG